MSSRRRETEPHSQRPLQPQYVDRFHPQNESVAPPHDDHFQQPGRQRQRETNPHFLRSQHPPLRDDHSHPPPAPEVRTYGDDNPLGPHSTVPPQVTVPQQVRRPISPGVPHIKQVDRRPSWSRGKAKERPKLTTPIVVASGDQSAPKPTTKPSPLATWDQSAPKPTSKSSPQVAVTTKPSPVSPDSISDRRPKGRLPQPQKTEAYTWFAAVFCVIFWLIIIIGGLIVLIVYLVFRPQSPHFDVSSVTLNAAYLDLGYLLNADITVLANFTNPNKKVHVHFSSMIIDLYYGSTLIATQYVEPFSAAKSTSRFAAIHMVSSQVWLPLKESQRLMKQMETNGVLFEVKGIFRATSKLGSILTYSYNLYGLCNIMVTRPPDGVMVKRKCRTKR